MRRRQARELALKVLFQVDVAGADADEAMSFLLGEEKVSERALRFATDLVRGTLEHLDEIDATLANLSREWTLERMANIDRNVLRIGCYELMYCDDIPASVAISEAIEISRKYGDAESSRFVNGILGAIVQNLNGKSRAID